MDLELAGRHVLITGGSKGIGYACAETFCREGAHVTLAARSAVGLDDAVARLTAQGFMARALRADLADPAAASAMVDAAWTHAPVDVLVNSAGAARRTPFPDLTPQAWHDAMLSKFFTYIHVIDPLIKRMGEAGRGVVINIVGMGGKVASPTHLAGGSANAALMLASAGLAHAYAPKGVRVNAVNPTSTLTERLQEGMKAEARLRNVSTEEALKQVTARLPLGRVAEPREVADAVVFLASARASYINGVILAMDGGITPMVV